VNGGTGTKVPARSRKGRMAAGGLRWSRRLPSIDMSLPLPRSCCWPYVPAVRGRRRIPARESPIEGSHPMSMLIDAEIVNVVVLAAVLEADLGSHRASVATTTSASLISAGRPERASSPRPLMPPR
jgi:hypothetical protein